MKNDIERILEDYEIDDSDGLNNDLENYLKGQLEDAYNSLKDDIDNSLSTVGRNAPTSTSGR